MAWYNWSQTAASNANADSSINWAEGMAPSAVNDSARAMMAVTAKYRDDISGAIVTGGTSTAYTVTSNSSFDTLAHLNGQLIAFAPNATSTNAVGVDVTLNVDGLGAKSIRMQPGVALPGGTLVSGTPYVVVYNNSDGVFYLHNMTSPYSIPLGGMMPYLGSTAPNSSFVLPFGQAISRSTYSTLFSLIGTTFGSGDGSTTFNIIDLRGRLPVGKDDMGGSAASRVTTAGSSVDGTTIGATGGAQNQTLTLAQLPTGITSTGTVSVTSTVSNVTSGSGTNNVSNGTGVVLTFATAGSSSAITSTGSNTLTSNNTSGSAHPIMQPSIIVPWILRVI